MPKWGRSARCNGNTACIDIAFEPQGVLIRDSKSEALEDRSRWIEIGLTEYELMKAQVASSKSIVSLQSLSVEVLADGGARFSSQVSGITLVFDSDEWSAFTAALPTDDFASIEQD